MCGVPLAASPTTLPCSPVGCAESLRSISLDDGAELIARLDPRAARLVLCALRGRVWGDCAAPTEVRDHDEGLRLLLQIRVGIFDWAIQTSASGHPRFAVGPEAQRAVDKVALARLEELVAATRR